MIPENQMYFELLPIEIEERKLKNLFTVQLKKGISLTQIIPSIEKDSIEKIKRAVSHLSIKKNDEIEFIKIRRMINEALKWLEYLVVVQKKNTLQRNST